MSGPASCSGPRLACPGDGIRMVLRCSLLVATLSGCVSSGKGTPERPTARAAPSERGAGGASQRSGGDIDGDGTEDAVDRCPKASGPGINQGCPLPAPDTGAWPQPKLLPPWSTREQTEAAILFQPGSARVASAQLAKLDQVAEALRRHPRITVRIEGHCDSKEAPSERGAERLATQRAASVKLLLLKRGVAGNRMAAVGHGRWKPVASNLTASGRRLNRRVTFIAVGD